METGCFSRIFLDIAFACVRPGAACPTGGLHFARGVVECPSMQEKRKIAVLVGDGMGDDPVAALGGKTPLQVAKMPDIRRVAALGHVQLVQTVPDGMAPGSDVANMGLLGYHAGENYTGRAAIEAAGLTDKELANDGEPKVLTFTTGSGRSDLESNVISVACTEISPDLVRNTKPLTPSTSPMS